MIRSMTGFGRGEAADEYRKVSVEIKSVNHRYFDLSVHIPKRLTASETGIRSILKESVFRGKIDLSVNYEDHTPGQTHLTYDRPLAQEYYRILCAMEEEFQTGRPILLTDIARFPDVVTSETVIEDDGQMEALLEEALRAAANAYNGARETEGAALKADLNMKLSGMLEAVDRIEECYPQVVAQYRKKLTDKLSEVLEDTQIDENRLAAEIVLYADKIAVDEETVRLRTHIQSMIDTLEEDGSIGRKLDFLAQEMNREANTILSKSTDREIADIAITLKTDVERVREQIQNIE